MNELESRLCDVVQNRNVEEHQNWLQSYINSPLILSSALNLLQRSIHSQNLTLLVCGVLDMWLRMNSDTITVEITNQVLECIAPVFCNDNCECKSKICSLYRSFSLRFLYDCNWSNIVPICAPLFCSSVFASKALVMASSLFRLFGNDWLVARPEILETLWNIIAPTFAGPITVLSKYSLKIYNNIFAGFGVKQEVVEFIDRVFQSCVDDYGLLRLCAALLSRIPDFNMMSCWPMLARCTDTVMMYDLLRAVRSLSCPDLAVFAQILTSCAALAESDLHDFHTNPHVYCECVFSLGDESVRSLAHQIVSSNEALTGLVMSLPKCESSMFLVYGNEHPIIAEYYLSCVSPDLSLLDLATLLFVLPMTIPWADHAQLLQFAMLGLTHGVPVVTTMAIRLIRKMAKRGITIDQAVCETVFQNAHLCVTKDAAQLIHGFVRSAPQDFVPFLDSLHALISIAMDNQTVVHYLECYALLMEHLGPNVQQIAVITMALIDDFEGISYGDLLVDLTTKALKYDADGGMFVELCRRLTANPKRLCSFYEPCAFVLVNNAVLPGEIIELLGNMSLMLALSEEVEIEEKPGCAIVLALCISKGFFADSIPHLANLVVNSDEEAYIVGVIGASLITSGKQVHVESWLSCIRLPVYGLIGKRLVHDALVIMELEVESFLQLPASNVNPR